MSIVTVIDAHKAIPGAYVYLLLCRDAEAIHIKIGYTSDPWSRFIALRITCPLTPRSYSLLSVPTRERAIELEKKLHQAFARWHSRGEWFAFSVVDKTDFNRKLQEVLLAHATPAWPLKIQKISVDALIKLASERKRAGLHALRKSLRKNGRSFKDFVKDSGENPIANVVQRR